MGAIDFYVIAEGNDADAALQAAAARARHEYGHGGYTGTIAEKHACVVVSDAPLACNAAMELAAQLIEGGDERIDDKWGPAGAIELEGGSRWLLFGLAPE